jgi:hypothetical protein
MGWWGYDIMSGDTPLDIEGDFEDRFGDNIPTADETLAFIREQSNPYDDPVFMQVMGYLLINKAAPISPDLKKAILNALDNDESDNWDSVDERKKAISEFRDIVEEYPEGGATVTLPFQPGLFDVICSGK